MRSSFQAILSVFLLHSTDAFHISAKSEPRKSTHLFVSRYGPPVENNFEGEGNFGNEQTKAQFRRLLDESLALSNREHLPKLLANNMEIIASLQGDDGARVISDIVEEAKAEGQEQYQQTILIIDTILTFAETFVEQANEMDEHNKKLLGKIIKTMTSKNEDTLDELMEAEKNNFSAGFLRHLEGECERITSASKVTPESARLLEILRIVQARVLEELGADMGEAALVLGQLMGYDDRDELLGVLEAGLTVQGRDFAHEMESLTKEALEGFESVRGGVEPELVERVKFVDQRLKQYLDETNKFQ